MDPACLEYCLTDPERDEFEQNGFFVVADVLPPRLIEELSAGCPLGEWIVSMRSIGRRWFRGQEGHACMAIAETRRSSSSVAPLAA